MQFPPLPPLSLGNDSGIPAIHAQYIVAVIVMVLVVLMLVEGRTYRGSNRHRCGRVDDRGSRHGARA